MNTIPKKEKMKIFLIKAEEVDSLRGPSNERVATVIIGDATEAHRMVISGLPLQGDLQTMLDNNIDKIWANRAGWPQVNYMDACAEATIGDFGNILIAALVTRITQPNNTPAWAMNVLNAANQKIITARM